MSAKEPKPSAFLDSNTDDALRHLLATEFAPDTSPQWAELVAYAEETLEPAERTRIQQHLQTSPDSALAVAELRQLFAPLRTLHRGWWGWLGAWKGARITDETERAAWDEHCGRCARCQQRKERVDQIRQGGFALPSLSFMGGSVVTACLLLLFLRPSTPIKTPSIDGNGLIITPSDPKTGEGNASGWLNAPEMLEKFLFPDPKQLPSVIEHWEESAANHPNDSTIWTALQRLYRQQSGQATNATEKAEWLRKAEGARQKVKSLLSQTPQGGK